MTIQYTYDNRLQKVQYKYGNTTAKGTISL